MPVSGSVNEPVTTCPMQMMQPQIVQQRPHGSVQVHTRSLRVPGPHSHTSSTSHMERPHMLQQQRTALIIPQSCSSSTAPGADGAYITPTVGSVRSATLPVTHVAPHTTAASLAASAAATTAAEEPGATLGQHSYGNRSFSDSHRVGYKQISSMTAKREGGDRGTAAAGMSAAASASVPVVTGGLFFDREPLSQVRFSACFIHVFGCFALKNHVCFIGCKTHECFSCRLSLISPIVFRTEQHYLLFSFSFDPGNPKTLRIFDRKLQPQYLCPGNMRG